MKKHLLIFSLITLIAIGLDAQIIHVPLDQPTIQEGINSATNGDTVLVDDGTYNENIRFMGKAITVASNFILDADTNHINNTIIDGSQAQHPDSAATVMFVSGEDTTSIINGFTVTGGTGVFMTLPWQVKCGGGIYAYYSGAKIINNRIVNNYVEGDMAGGSGIAAIGEDTDPWAVISNNFISNNNSESFGFIAFGGGIAVTTNSIIKNNIIQYNTCSNPYQLADGGGIEVDAIPGSIPETYIYNNIIQFNEINGVDFVWGAGISINNAQTTISNNIVQHNITNGTDDNWGGGISCRIAFGVISNNLIIHNEAHGNNNSFGGGIYLDPPTASDIILTNNTILNNSAATAGGGIYSISISTELTNSILWNNYPDEIAGSFPVTYSNVMGDWVGEGNIDEDPVFVGSGDFPFSLQDSSPCVNSGTPDITGLYLPELDLAGNPRLYGGRIDMGVYENQNVILTGQHELFNQPNFNLSVYPNPITDQATIKFSLPDPYLSILSIFDISGKQVGKIDSREYTKGKNEIEWNAEKLKGGIYFIRLETEYESQVHKVIIIK